MKPAISVVICVKDRSELLRQALTSVRLQTFADWECIVVDDHSTEDIQTLVESFEQPRFRYVRNEGKPGISSSRNLGNRLAQADWIAVADSDDINLPRRLARTYEAIQDNPQADVVYAAIYTFLDGSYAFRINPTTQAYDRETLYQHDIIPHGTAAYRKDLALAVPYNEELDSAVDYDLWLSLADQHANFVFIEEPLMLYRLHSEQITTDPDKRARQLENTRRVLEAHPYQV